MTRNYCFGYLFVVACGLVVLGGMPTTAEAISTVLFADNFEQGTVGSAWDNGTQPGAWTLSGAPLVASAAPGPFEGSQYGHIARNTGTADGIATVTFGPVSTGRLDLDTRVRIPGTDHLLTIAFGDTIGTNPATTVPHSYVTFHVFHGPSSTYRMEENNIGAAPKWGQYLHDEWMRLQVSYDYDNPASGYSATLTNTAGTFNYTAALEHSGQPINSLVIKFEDTAGDTAFFDAFSITHTVIPEPSCLMLLGIGGIVMLASARRRAAMRHR